MNKPITIPGYAKIKVLWDDKPENYSRANKLKVRNYFNNKYGVAKESINVIFRPVKTLDNGDVIEITGAGIENIMDRNYQVELMKEWYKREEKNVDFNRLLDLDKKVNASLDTTYEVNNNRTWELKWMSINNFLCFGEKNFVSFSRLTGLNIVTSEPLNQGGKTTFSVDAIKYLLFGKTTKTDKNEQIFNSYSDKDDLMVRGMIQVEGEEIIIERKMTRKEKRAGGWTIINKLNYYRLLPDGEEEDIKGEDATKTSEKITQTIGSEHDFDATVLATGRNLQDLLEAKATESGRLLTKFIGLEIVEMKLEIAKEFYKEFNTKKKGNHYDITTLTLENENLTSQIGVFNDDLIKHKRNLVDSKGKLDILEKRKESLLSSKLPVDVIISQLNPTTIETDIATITASGLVYKNKIIELNKEIEPLKGKSFDEDSHHALNIERDGLNIGMSTLTVEIIGFGKEIDLLKDSEICQTCKRPLEDIDNADKIKEVESKVKTKKNELNIKKVRLNEVNTLITNINTDRALVDKRNRLELDRDKCEVEIGALRNQIIEKRLDLDKYKANEQAITFNIETDTAISSVKTDIVVETTTRDGINRSITNTEYSINTANDSIIGNKEIIVTLQGEAKIEKLYKVYLEMFGKKGISKLVLRSVLPIINSELIRLLDDVCDFEIELIMTDKNDVEYLLIKDDVIKPIKSASGFELTISSLAIRSVLGKISHLPTPNFITFDEVLGKVAKTNLEKMKPMFEKIKDMYEIVFLITHKEEVKDWGDNIIMINKINNISTINVN
tara:strand:- start:1661 stop:4012 length:2352 start_codon:yes stop_codon:yes gene_type:complete